MKREKGLVLSRSCCVQGVIRRGCRVKPVEERDMKISTPPAASSLTSPLLASASKGGLMKSGSRKSIGGSGGGLHIRLDMGANIVAGDCIFFVICCPASAHCNRCRPFGFTFSQNSTKRRPPAASRKQNPSAQNRSSSSSSEVPVTHVHRNAARSQKIISPQLQICKQNAHATTKLFGLRG
jgi:hypothetical protein